ncbi:hypothetical protein Hdeb2414_s0021g00569121 [Helianthus debilis subsp. tardiflorus]
MGIRVLSGVQFLEVLAYLLLLCNEDTGPITPALIFRGVTWSLMFEILIVYGSLNNTNNQLG